MSKTLNRVTMLHGGHDAILELAAQDVECLCEHDPWRVDRTSRLHEQPHLRECNRVSLCLLRADRNKNIGVGHDVWSSTPQAHSPTSLQTALLESWPACLRLA